MPGLRDEPDDLTPDELRWWQWGPPALALLAVFALLLVGDQERALRVIAAFGAACAVVCGLLEVLREQYKLAAERRGLGAQATAFAMRAFHVKQIARLWGLVAVVTAVGAVAPGRDERFVAAAIMLIIGAVLWTIGGDVVEERAPTPVPGPVLRATGAAIALAAVLLAAGLLVL